MASARGPRTGSTTRSVSSRSRRSIARGRMFRSTVSDSSTRPSGGAADQFDHLYVLPVAGGAPYKMTFGDHDDFHPRWSPDGEWIAYISNEGGLPQLLCGNLRRSEKQTRDRRRGMEAADGRVGPDRGCDETAAPTPARVHLTASDGKFYPPSRRLCAHRPSPAITCFTRPVTSDPASGRAS